MTKQEAIDLARKVAEEHDWPWLECVTALRRRAWFRQESWWEIESYRSVVGSSKVRVVIEDQT